MSDRSAIEWTDATWNVTTGCTKVSPECAHCYIERTVPFRTTGRRFVKGHIPLQFHPNRLEHPLHWKRPRMVFVDSLSDLFHDDVPDAYLDRVFAVMALCPQHTFQVLTKRAERMRAYLTTRDRRDRVAQVAAQIDGDPAPDLVVRFWPLLNVWLGVSAGNRRMWQARVPPLLHTPAALHWVSIEPCLEAMVDELFTICLCSGLGAPPSRDKIDWLVLGGESGPIRRPFELTWLAEIVDAARTYHTPVFVKQDTGFRSGQRGRIPQGLWIREFPARREVYA